MKGFGMNREDKILIGLGIIVIMGITSIFVMSRSMDSISSRDIQKVAENEIPKKEEIVEIDEVKEEIITENKKVTKKDNAIETKEVSEKTEDENETYTDCVEVLDSSEPICKEKDYHAKLKYSGGRKARELALAEIATDLRDEVFGGSDGSDDPSYGELCKVIAPDIFSPAINFIPEEATYLVLFCDANGEVVGEMPISVDGVDKHGVEYIGPMYFQSYGDAVLKKDEGLPEEAYKFNEKLKIPRDESEVITEVASKLNINESDISYAKLISSDTGLFYQVKENDGGNYYVSAFVPDSVTFSYKEMAEFINKVRNRSELSVEISDKNPKISLDELDRRVSETYPYTEKEKKYMDDVKNFMIRNSNVNN